MSFSNAARSLLTGSIIMVLFAVIPAVPSHGQVGDENYVFAMDVDVTNNRVVIGYQDRSLSVRDLATQALLLTIPEPAYAVGADTQVGLRLYDVAFSPEGDKVAVSYNGLGYGGVLRVHNSITGEMLNEFRPGVGAFDLDWSPDGNFVGATYNASGGTAFSTHLGVWNVVTDALVTDIDFRDFARNSGMGLAWSPDGSQVAFEANNIYLWNTTTWQQDTVIVAETDEVLSLQWSPSGDRIASLDYFGTVRIYDITSGQETQVLEGNGQGLRIQRFSWNPSGEQIAVTSDDLTKIRIWNVNSADIVSTLDVGDWVMALVWTEDNLIYYVTNASDVVQTFGTPIPEPRYKPAIYQVGA